MDSILRLVGLALVLLVPACSSGPKLHKVSGQLVFKDQPYRGDSKGSLIVKLTQVVTGDTAFDAYVADINREDGSFTVPGRDGTGIPAGKYRISIFQLSLEPTSQINDMNARFSPENSQIIRDIADGSSLVIDLAKPEG